jgi:hypothetical protein
MYKLKKNTITLRSKNTVFLRLNNYKMKIVCSISTSLEFYREFIPTWGLVICGCDHLKPPAISKSSVHGICQIFKYSSDFIWMLGKNNFDSLKALVFAPNASAGT